MTSPGAPEMADAPRPGPRMVEWADRLLETAGLCGFVAMMLATLLQVAARHLQISIDWTEELARILFLAAIMIGAAIAIRRRQHIMVDFLFAASSPRSQAALSIGFDLATLVLLVIWLRGSLRLMGLNAGTTFVTLPWLPVSVLYGIEALGVGLMILFVLTDLVGRFHGIRERKPTS
jgi:TRAP-type transport system small permease protein